MLVIGFLNKFLLKNLWLIWRIPPLAALGRNDKCTLWAVGMANGYCEHLGMTKKQVFCV